MRRRYVAVLAAVAPLVGCGSGPRLYPLYPTADPEDAIATERVARLYGPIASVDGRAVADKGNAFALLPGCHVVELAGSFSHGEMSNNGQSGGQISGNLGTWIFAIPMRAGAIYVVTRNAEQISSGLANVVTRAEEHDADGNMRELAPARTTADLEACRQAGSTGPS